MSIGKTHSSRVELKAYQHSSWGLISCLSAFSYVEQSIAIVAYPLIVNIVEETTATAFFPLLKEFPHFSLLTALVPTKIQRDCVIMMILMCPCLCATVLCPLKTRARQTDTCYGKSEGRQGRLTSWTTFQASTLEDRGVLTMLDKR